ncbi:MAG: response regulator transcription factor [Clostridiaceae bacterium]|jgi:two-component system response regulator VicR|nr:response regulator transcription factor [Clostridiaceae bacterium]
MAKVLIVEDEKAIVDLIAFNLKREGYEVQEAYDGQQGLEKAQAQDIDLVLLDVMLPYMDGFEVLRRLRQKSDVPVLMVTAREEERDKILGLETGADDYITKPFSTKELTARVKANIRRRLTDMGGGQGQKSRSGPFEVNYELRTAAKNGKPLELSQREFDMLCYFLAAPGRVIAREELMEKVWGFEYYGDLRAVDVAIRRLREKLEDNPADPQYLITRRGAGYYFNKG